MSDKNDGARLRAALQELSQGVGVQRPDLLAALAGDLSALQECWSVNLANGSEVARATVVANLRAHIRRLPIPRTNSEVLPAKRGPRYWHIIEVNFNLGPGLEHMDVTARRKWLSEHPDSALRVSEKTSRRYLDAAIVKIADQILAANYQPITTDSADSSDRVIAPVDPAPPRKTPRKNRKNSAWLAAAVTVAVLAAGGVVYLQQSGSSGDPQSSHHTDPPKASVSTSANTEGIGAKKSPAGGRLTGNYLSISNVYSNLGALDATDSAVFPPSAIAAAPHGIFTQTKMPDELPSESQLAADEMAAGGYLLGGATITPDVRAIGKSAVTIHNIRVVNLKRLPVVTGKAFVIFPQGGGNEHVQFILDDAVPTGRYITTQGERGTPWSETRHSTVTATTKDTLTLVFVALRYAYTFNVAFDYEVNDKSYTQIMNGDDGKPLLVRVSASLCPPSDFRNQLSSADLAKLSALHYSGLHTNLMTNYYSVADADPKLYSPNGIACPSYPKSKTGQGE